MGAKSRESEIARTFMKVNVLVKRLNPYWVQDRASTSVEESRLSLRVIKGLDELLHKQNPAYGVPINQELRLIGEVFVFLYNKSYENIGFSSISTNI